jgi:hypothetical protein
MKKQSKWVRTIDISGENGIKVQTAVEETNKGYHTAMFINGERVNSQFTPKRNPQLIFANLKAGAHFYLVDRGDKAVFMKLKKKRDNYSAVWLEDGTDSLKGSWLNSAGDLCIIQDEANVEEIIDL